MKVLLTAPPLADLDAPGKKEHLHASPNLGIYLLASVLSENGQKVKLIDPSVFEDRLGTAELAASETSDVDVLAVSINSCTWPRALRLFRELEEKGKRPLTIIGGPHASVLDEHVASFPVVDYVIRGEGERSFPRLLECLGKGADPGEVPGITFFRGDRLVKTDQGTLLTPEELAELPMPAFDLMPEGYYDLVPIETSRGCYHACIFCSISFKRKWRGMGPSTLAERFQSQERYLDKTRRQSFFIIDDCFTADHDRLSATADVLSGIDSPLCFEARITDVIAPGVLDSIQRLPVAIMEMGVESGYAEGLQKMGKGLKMDQVMEAIALLEKIGFGDKARFSFVMGLPWETRQEILKTLEFAFKITGRMGARLIASWLTVFPGSIIYKTRGKWGIEMDEKYFDNELWWRSGEVFERTHPGLDMEKDVDTIVTYIKMMKELFPQIQHDGFFRWL